MENIASQLHDYIRENFLHSPEEKLDDSTPLLSSGIIDSISALELVDFLESAFQLEFKPHEVDQDNLNTIKLMEQFILRKKAE